MQERKNFLLISILLIIALIGGFYVFAVKEVGLREAMMDAFADHQHEDAIVHAANLLESVPGNQSAEKILKKSGQILYYLNAAKSALTGLGGTDDSPLDKPEELYEGFILAREYISKAKALDPQFESILEFEDELDETQSAFSNVLSLKMIELGHGAVSIAGSNYQNTSDMVDAASSSDYLSSILSVQSAWGAVKTPIETLKQKIDQELTRMEAVNGFISSHKNAGTEKLTASLSDYIEVVNKTIETLLVPKGSYLNFAKTAEEAMNGYKKQEDKLTDIIPSSAKNDRKFADIIDNISDYQLFNDQSTLRIISDNRALYE